MKKKLLIALLSMTATASCAFGLAACNDDSDSGNINGGEIANINQAYNVATELGYDGTLDEFIIAIKGENGADGKDGKDGVGVDSISKNEDGELIIVLTDKNEFNLGKLNGGNGADGLGIIKAEFNEDGEVVFTYSDGSSENIGKIPNCAHSYGEWTVVEEATCTSIGFSTRVCSACGYKDYEFTRTKGHYWDWGITLIEATCTQDGYKQYSCYECYTVKSEKVPATGHSYRYGWCKTCDRKYYSEGLEYALSDDGTHYILKGMGTCKDTDLIIPETYNELPVVEIDNFAYNQRLNIKSVTIPRYVTSIARFAFTNCTALEKVYFNAENCADLADWGSDGFNGSGSEHGISVIIGKDVQKIPANLFNWRSSSSPKQVNVVSLEFEEGSVCESIGDRAFHSSGLIEVTLPDSVTVIGEGAFGQSGRLRTVNLGNGVVTVKNRVFEFCDNLENLSIPDSIRDLGINYFVYGKKLKFNEYKNCFYLGNAENPYTVLVDVKTEEEKSYEIHPSTKLINDGAFQWCTRLESITIPEGVVTVCRAFGYCYSLKEINLPSTVTSFINGFTLRNIKKFRVSENNPVYYVKDDCIIDRTTKTLVAGCNTSIIPTDGSVTAIGFEAFRGCNSENFVNIVLPECITSIDDMAFSECDKLVSIKLPENLTHIGNFAFRFCDSLKSISIPDGVTELGPQAFMGCESLETVGLPAGFTKFESGVFQGCKNLKSFTLPDGMESIVDYMFARCASLESITLPKEVTAIGSRAFYECANLKTVYFKGTQEEWEELLKKAEGGNDVLKDVTVYFVEE